MRAVIEHVGKFPEATEARFRDLLRAGIEHTGEPGWGIVCGLAELVEHVAKQDDETVGHAEWVMEQWGMPEACPDEIEELIERAMEQIGDAPVGGRA